MLSNLNKAWKDSSCRIPYSLHYIIKIHSLFVSLIDRTRNIIPFSSQILHLLLQIIKILHKRLELRIIYFNSECNRLSHYTYLRTPRLCRDPKLTFDGMSCLNGGATLKDARVFNI